MKACFTFAFLLASVITNAQNNFHKLYTVPGAQCSHIAMAATGGGNAMVAYHCETGSGPFIGIKDVDTGGNMLWANAFPLPVGAFVPVTMTGTPDSGAVLALLDTILMSSVQLWKVSKSGDIQWARSFPATYFSLYQLPIAAMNDGTIFFANSFTDSLSLTKMTAAGNILWSKTYKAPSGSGFNPSSIVNNGTAIYIGGYEINSYSAYLLKTDTLGNIIWQKNGFGISASLNLSPAPSGGGVIVSTTNVYPIRVGMLDSAGTTVWDNGLALKSPKMVRINNNRIALCMEDSNIIKTVIMDTQGVIQQTASYHDALTSDDFAVAAIPGYGFWVSSLNNDKVWLMKADVTGSTSCFSQPYAISMQNDSFNTGPLSLSPYSPLIAFSNIVTTIQNINITDSTLCGTLAVNDVKSSRTLIYPNPLTDKLTITQATGDITITDVFGKLVFQNSIQGDTIVNTSKWLPGLYFIRVQDQKNISAYKVLKL